MNLSLISDVQSSISPEKQSRYHGSQMLEGSNQVTNEARNMTAITEEINGGINEMAKRKADIRS